ncbi:hypothetical protein PIL02S_03343 [Paenibacillus illinoisensis]|uniref:Uncharacterized protein n=1 Tax=Paenibacillus illinoisensis TaxID=59845 RepID=A0A2W0C834_9BACL|nr:hypothetical protein PIL02S_03343 [Paenibacillus illinoisensis]
MYPEMSYLDISNKLEILRKKQRQINIEISSLEELKSRKLSEDYGGYTLGRKKDIYDPYPTVRF